MPTYLYLDDICDIGLYAVLSIIFTSLVMPIYMHHVSPFYLGMIVIRIHSQYNHGQPIIFAFLIFLCLFICMFGVSFLLLFSFLLFNVLVCQIIISYNTPISIAVHGEPLLGVIRVCYNIALHRYFLVTLRCPILALSSSYEV